MLDRGEHVCCLHFLCLAEAMLAFHSTAAQGFK